MPKAKKTEKPQEKGEEFVSGLVGKIHWDDVKEHFVIQKNSPNKNIDEIVTEEQDVRTKAEEEAIEKTITQDNIEAVTTAQRTPILNYVQHVVQRLYDQEQNQSVGQILYSIQQIREMGTANPFLFGEAMQGLQEKLEEAATSYDDVSAYYVAKVIGMLERGYDVQTRKKEIKKKAQ